MENLSTRLSLLEASDFLVSCIKHVVSAVKTPPEDRTW